MASGRARLLVFSVNAGFADSDRRVSRAAPVLSAGMDRGTAGKPVNLDLPTFAYRQTLPTCEAIAAYLFPRIAARLPAGVVLERVRIEEDPTLYADRTGSL